MAQLFTDGFEAGNWAAWDGTTITAGTTLAIMASAAMAGSLGQRATHSTAGDNNYEAKATKLFVPPVTALLYADALVRLTSVTGVGYGAVGSKAVLAVRAEDGQEQAWFSLRNGGLRFGYRSRSGQAVNVNSSIPLAPSTPVYLRILVNRAGPLPIVEGWISANGIDWMSVGNASDVTLGTQGVGKASGQVDVGVVHISNFEPGMYTIDHDAVTISDSIGVRDWQVESHLVQPVRFASQAVVEHPATSDITYRLTAAHQGVMQAVADARQPISLTTAFSGHREAVTASHTAVDLTGAVDGRVTHDAATSTSFKLVTEQQGGVDFQSGSDVRFVSRFVHHTMDGTLEEPAMVTVTDLAWGEVTVIDTEG